MPFDVTASIARHRRINPDHFLLTLEAPAVARAARPGQFVMLQAGAARDPLLRRPMSVCRIAPGRRGRLDILYKVVGEGTRLLSRQPAGGSLGLHGPLGNGFALPKKARGAPPPRPIFVAGGIGVAIFPFVAAALKARRLPALLLFGARRKNDLVGLDLFRGLGVTARVATEDGSAGERGYVTRLVEAALDDPAARAAAHLYVCGPTPMMRAVAALALAAGVPCDLALEAHMPCGIGVCLGCVVRCRPDARGPVFRRVCTEGPVFEAAQVAWS
jgi:dihydroorotate dehydrogenase electron transfer subunit